MSKENIYLFLISILISLIIWYGITYSNILKKENWEKEIPIDITIPEKLVLKEISSGKIKIYGKGKIPPDSEISIKIPIEKIKEGHYKIGLTKDFISIPEGCEIIKIEPQEIDIKLERKVIKEVPFILPPEIEKKYILNLEPSKARVAGAFEDLQNFNGMPIPSFPVPKKIPSNILLPLSSPSKDIILLSPLTLEIQIEGEKK